MDSLRLILFLIGSAIVAFIYLYSRKKSGKPFEIKPLHKQHKQQPVKEPETEEEIVGAVRSKRYASDQPDDDAITQLSETLSQGVQDKVSSEDVDESVPSMVDEASIEPLLIVLTIMTKPGELFNGKDVYDAALANGFVHGDMNIFHFYTEQDNRRAICSLANAVEPGYFEMENIEQIQTPGLTLFMQIPGPIESREAFEQTIKLGRAMAEQLQGDLCDEARSVLTMQTTEHLKEKVEAHMFKARMNHIKQHRH
ncbi:MAG: cell division protein ZipA [Gammaproteobacteria bacterium]|jgi:cell division protein ZipA